MVAADNTAAARPGRARELRYPLAVFFLLAFGISWGLGGLCLLGSWWLPQSYLALCDPLYFVAGYGPSIAGIVVVGLQSGWHGIGRLLARLLPSRANGPMYLAVLVGYPAVAIALGWATTADVWGGLDPWHGLGLLIVTAPLADTGPLGEELGWRGVALPRLLARWAPFSASLILGVAWAAWHLPAFVIPRFSQGALSIPQFLICAVAISITQTALYRRSRGDLLLAVAMHLAANIAAALVPFAWFTVLNVLVAALATRRRRVE